VYQFGTLFTTGAFGTGFLGGLLAVLAMAGVIVAMILRSNTELKTEYAVRS
jgi:ferrous iron transport protein B